MPIYSIQTPSGRILDIEADNEERALVGAQQWHDDADAVVRTVYGEARSDPDSQAAVASTILNRANLTGKSPREIVLEKNQFEPWNKPETRAQLEGLDPQSREYQDILDRVTPALGGEDVTGGATHFYAPRAQAALGRNAPSWDDGAGRDIGLHRFFSRPGDFRAAGDGSVVAREDQAPLNEAQTAVYKRLQAEGRLDANAAPGSDRLPLAQRDAKDMAKPGQWYVDVDGQMKQVPDIEGRSGGGDPGAPEGFGEGLMRRADSAVRGAADVMTLGYADELAAKVDELLGNGTYEDNVAGQRMRDRADARDVPVTRAAGQIVGGVALPGAKFIAAGKTLPATIGRSAAMGAGLGAGYGSGAAEDDARVRGAIQGAASGAVLGAATPPVVGILSKVLDPVTRRLRPDAIQRMAKPDRKVGAAIERAAVRDDVPLESLRPTESPLLPFEAAGENLLGLAEIAGQVPGPARQMAKEVLTDRSAKAGDRVKSEIATSLGGKGDYFATLEAKQAERKALAMPYRDAAFSKPVDPEKFASEIAPVLPRVPAKALSYAAEIAKREGVDPSDLGWEAVGADPAGLPIMKQVKQPTMQTLHYVKKGLDQEIETYRTALGSLDTSGNPMASAAVTVRKDLAQALRRADKDYDKFMQTWGDESRQIDAMELGRNVFSGKFEINAETLKKRWGEMNEAERDSYRKGMGEALVAQVRSRRGGVGAMRDMLKSEEFKDRISIAFPSVDSFESFVKSAQREVDMQDHANTVLGGSPTARREAAREDMTDGPGVMDAVLGMATMDARALAGPALKQALKALPRKERDLLKDFQTNKRLGEVLFKEPDQMTKLLNQMQAARARQALEAKIAARLTQQGAVQGN